MTFSNMFFDDMHINPEDMGLPKKEDMLGPSELLADSIQCAPQSQTSITNSVHELLGCPVCLNAMYPPNYQV